MWDLDLGLSLNRRAVLESKIASIMDPRVVLDALENR